MPNDATLTPSAKPSWADEVDYSSLREMAADARKRISKTQTAIASIITLVETARVTTHTETALASAFEEADRALAAAYASLDDADDGLSNAFEALDAVIAVEDAEKVLRNAREHLAELRPDTAALNT